MLKINVKPPMAVKRTKIISNMLIIMMAFKIPLKMRKTIEIRYDKDDDL